jgi:hypothetical protein
MSDEIQNKNKLTEISGVSHTTRKISNCGVWDSQAFENFCVLS